MLQPKIFVRTSHNLIQACRTASNSIVGLDELKHLGAATVEGKIEVLVDFEVFA